MMSTARCSVVVSYPPPVRTRDIGTFGREPEKRFPAPRSRRRRHQSCRSQRAGIDPDEGRGPSSWAMSCRAGAKMKPGAPGGHPWPGLPVSGPGYDG